MIPIQCRKCRHVQDAGSAFAPNDTCERCGTPIFGPQSADPAKMALLAIITLVGAFILGMPWGFLLFIVIVALLFIGTAIIKRTRVRSPKSAQDSPTDWRDKFISSLGDNRLKSTQDAPSPMHGVRIGKIFKCEVCGRRMQKIGMPRSGGVMLDKLELAAGVGVADECRECGRAYCFDCYQNRPRMCDCGVSQDAVCIIDGVNYTGSLFLVKVRHLSEYDEL